MAGITTPDANEVVALHGEQAKRCLDRFGNCPLPLTTDEFKSCRDFLLAWASQRVVGVKVPHDFAMRSYRLNTNDELLISAQVKSCASSERETAPAKSIAAISFSVGKRFRQER